VSPPAHEGIRRVGAASSRRSCDSGQATLRAHPPIQPAREHGPHCQSVSDWVTRSRGRPPWDAEAGLEHAAIAQQRIEGTVKVWAAYLRAALRWAWKSELIGRMPYVPSLRVDNARRGFFEFGEFERVVALLPKPVDDIARFADLTGWRKREILGLTWRWWTASAGCSACQTRRTVRGGCCRWSVSCGSSWNGGGRRGWSGTGYPSGSSAGTGIRCGRSSRCWRRACQEAGVPGRYLHDCRRTAARDMIAAGVSPHEAMQVTGHRSLAMFERYNIKTTREAERRSLRASNYFERSKGRPACITDTNTDTRGLSARCLYWCPCIPYTRSSC
jgi:hypothetical protein